MKPLLLFVAASLLSGNIIAQSYEIGINGGLSTTTKPNKSLYQGNGNVWNYAADVNYRYNISEQWQTGITIGLTQWQRTSDWTLTGPNNENLGDHQVKYLLADRAVSFGLELNRVFPFHKQYEDFVRSNLYVGITAGGVIVGNDGKTYYSKVNPKTPIEYSYISQYDFETGYGYLLGFQVGYTYFFGAHLGVNIECAPKVAWVGTNDSRYGGANNKFNLFYFPTTVGVHYRFGYRKY